MAPIDPDTEIALELGLDDPALAAADDPADDAALRDRVAARLGVPAADLPAIEIRKRSLDARRGSVKYRVTVGVTSAAPRRLGAPDPREVKPGPVVAIIGAGPAGLFCAYQLARAGVASVICDRGKRVQARRRDLKALQRAGRVDPDSNYCFGEGGAGTYSDGKLYTRAGKRGDTRDVLEILAVHGAPARILTDARPHIGSNKLPAVVTAIRERLEACGVQVLFDARVTDLITSRRGVAGGGGAGRAVTGVRLADGRELAADAVVVATGHSARDVHALLARAGVLVEAKPLAVGVRVEHPQPVIDDIQYGRAAGHPRLPAAAYSVSATCGDRGVFSFCMCPGGWIVPASTAPGEVVVNGMSLSRRDSPFANAGLVVAVGLADLADLADAARGAAGADDSHDAGDIRGPLAGVALQRRLETAAHAAGGGGQRAPATRVTDFLAGRGSTTAPPTSYIPGLTPTDIADVLAASGLDLAARLRQGLRAFDRRLRGFITEDAVLVGVETRTSSPVRVPRDPRTLTSPAVDGLYPCGEGAGYAGGITSAAIDGVRVANALIDALRR